MPDTDIAARAAEVTLADVLQHLVANSTGFPLARDREVHLAALRRHFGIDEYAADGQPAAVS